MAVTMPLAEVVTVYKCLSSAAVVGGGGFKQIPGLEGTAGADQRRTGPTRNGILVPPCDANSQQWIDLATSSPLRPAPQLDGFGSTSFTLCSITAPVASHPLLRAPAGLVGGRCWPRRA